MQDDFKKYFRILAGNLQVDDDLTEIPRLNISYKPQKISPKSQCSVRHLLYEKIPDMINHAQFKTDVLSPLMIDDLLNLEVKSLLLICLLRIISAKF